MPHWDRQEEQRQNERSEERERREEYTARVNDVPVQAVRQAQATVINYGSLAVPPVTTHPCASGILECAECDLPKSATCAELRPKAICDADCESCADVFKCETERLEKE
jgi:hypothetical protein